jgi:hypothetical protein
MGRQRLLQRAAVDEQELHIGRRLLVRHLVLLVDELGDVGLVAGQRLLGLLVSLVVIGWLLVVGG